MILTYGLQLIEKVTSYDGSRLIANLFESTECKCVINRNKK